MRGAQFSWYPYDTLTSLRQQVLPLLEAAPIDFHENVSSRPLLDLGCGDGYTAFFFESLGFRVIALDFELTSNNQMQGVSYLKQLLGSSVELMSANLDDRFEIRGAPFGLVLLLGVLYHLKNPFYILEYLAQSTKYCILTTRVARQTPTGTPIDTEALAYLLGPDELNHDPTNFWIFSPAGLDRLLSRSGWEVSKVLFTGCKERSDPVRADRDERACYLLRSRIAAGGFGAEAELLDGWYRLEEGTFRWTAIEFGARLRKAIPRGTKLHFRFTIVPALLHDPLILSTTVNGHRLPPMTYTSPGTHDCVQELPPDLCRESAQEIIIRFHLSHGFQAGEDQRTLGLLVIFWREGTETTDQNLPLELLC